MLEFLTSLSVGLALLFYLHSSSSSLSLFEKLDIDYRPGIYTGKIELEVTDEILQNRRIVSQNTIAIIVFDSNNERSYFRYGNLVEMNMNGKIYLMSDNRCEVYELQFDNHPVLGKTGNIKRRGGKGSNSYYRTYTIFSIFDVYFKFIEVDAYNQILYLEYAKLNDKEYTFIKFSTQSFVPFSEYSIDVDKYFELPEICN